MNKENPTYYHKEQTCKICGLVCKSLGTHIRYKHKDYTYKSYYDTFIKTNSDGVCKICHTPTTFNSIINGYSKYCSIKCKNLDTDTISKRIQTRIANHNGQYYSKDIANKIKSTRLKNYGYTCNICGQIVGNINEHMKLFHEDLLNKTFIYCKICNKKITQKGLSYHITHTHNITDKEYYDIYIKQPNEGYCQKCNNSTIFISLSQGYNKLCENHLIRPHSSIKCPICKIDIKNPAPHFNKIHHMSSKEFYDIYIKKDNEGKCLTCKKETKYINFEKGYEKYCSNTCDPNIDKTNMILCKICNQYVYQLGTHINKQHINISKQEYYDKYLKKDYDGLCEVCGKPTKFISVIVGYSKTCSKECGNKLASKKGLETCKKLYGGSGFQSEKTKQTLLERYGSENYFSSEEGKKKVKESNIKNNGGIGYASKKILNKVKQTNIQRYGVENPQQNEEIKEKVKQTNLKRYGGVAPIFNDSIKRKIQQTMIEHYGVKHNWLRKEVREKAIKNSQSYKSKCKRSATLLSNYGVTTTFKSNKIREKFKQSLLNHYGVDSPMKSIKIQEKIKQTNLTRYGVENPLQNKEIRDKTLENQKNNHDGKLAWNTEKQKETIKKYKKLDNTLNEDDL